MYNYIIQNDLADLLYSCPSYDVILEHTTTLFSLSDHNILSRRVIVDQVQTNYYYGRPMVL